MSDPTNPSPTPAPEATGTPAPAPAPSSPSAEPANPAPAAELANPAPEPAADPAQEARAKVPADGESYAVNVPETVRPYLGGEDDPGLNALQGYARKQGWDQGRFDDTLGFLEHCAGEGLLGEAFDPARELAALGDNGKARQTEQETFLTSLKERGEIDDGVFGELMSLTITAKGVEAVEKLRKMMGPAGEAPRAPGGEGGLGGDKAAQQGRAREMAADPKYNKDPAFTREADAAWKLAFSST